jgi:HEAT repeat protein
MTEVLTKRIFISHANADKNRLGPYISHLLERTSALPSPVQIWIDRPSDVGWPNSRSSAVSLGSNPRIQKIPAGLPWSVVISREVQRSQCVLLFLSDRAEPERSQVFANEIIAAILDRKCVTVSLDPIRKRGKPDILLNYLQWVDISRFGTIGGDGGAFDGVIDQAIALLFPDRQKPDDLFAATIGSSGQASLDIASQNDVDALSQIAHSQRERQIALLSGEDLASGRIIDNRYVAELFVERVRLSSALDQFVRSAAQTFSVLGDAGMGKSSFLCNAARELGRKNPVLFYLAIELGDSLSGAIEADLGATLSGGAFSESIVQLSSRLRAVDRSLYICLDALNEYPLDRDGLRAELNELMKLTENSAVRWIVSCRTHDWEFWIRNENGMIGRLGRSVYLDSREGESGSNVAGKFNKAEFDEAWQRYKATFRLKGEMSAILRSMCHEPLMLRIVSELYRGGKEIPETIQSSEVFERLLTEKFPSSAQLLLAYRCLFMIARRIISDGPSYIRVVDLTSEEFQTCRVLISENILVVRSSEHLHFRFELFLEFVLAKFVLGDIPDGSDRELKRQRIVDLAARPGVNIPGAIENILVHWQADLSLICSIISELVGKGDHLKTTICSVIQKMVTLPEQLDETIGRLAKDSNFVVRQYCSQAVARHDAADVSRLVGLLITDAHSWEARETAANILGAVDSGRYHGAYRDLWSLADDFHWRVRRAAGYAIHRMWKREEGVNTASNDRVAALKRLVTTSWRQRHALCIGLIGSDVAASATAEAQAIATMANDENHQVRWMVANYLPRYLGVDSKLLNSLLKDPDFWVRTRVASSLITLYSGEMGSDDIRQEIEELSADPTDEVKIRVARELAKINVEPWSERILLGYLIESSEVSFAAAYSLDSLGARSGNELFGRGEWRDRQARDWILRERIARSELNASTTRFASVQDYISQRFQLSAQNDRYMRVIDSMCSLIAATADALNEDVADQVPFLELLAGDVDESVRWALVMYLANFSAEKITESEKFKLLQRMSKDRHFWVRREVAIGLPKLESNNIKLAAHELLRDMRSVELSSQEACKDEVIFHIEEGLHSLELVLGELLRS